MTDGTLRIGGCVVDLVSGTVRGPEGERSVLRPKSAAVLRALAARPGGLVTKDELLATVWPGVVIEEDGLVQCVGEIRRVLGPAGRVAIRTHAKRGYSLELEPRAPPAPRRRVRPAVLALLALALVGTAALLGRSVQEAPAAAGPEPVQAARLDGPVVAVFPFDAPGGGPRWDRLATGLTRDVIADLAVNPWLFVLADAATRYAGDPSAAVARGLGAGYLLTGSVEAEEDVVRVSVALAEATTGRQLWARRLEGPVDELLDLRRQASEAMVGELGARWTGPIARAGKVRARAGAAEDLTAYELMLRAAEQMEAYTPESLAAAEALLRQAVAVQPDLGEAWAKLSLVSYNRVDPEMAPAEMEALWAQGHEAALEAYRVAPEHPMALAQAANVVRWDDPAEGERMTRRAAELAPNDADILAYLAFRAAHFPALGPEAVDWIDRAIRLNPARPNWYDWNRGTVMMVAGRHADAAEAYALAPDHIEAVAGRLSALALAGDVAAAQAGMTDLLRDRPHFTSAWFAEASGLHPDVAEVFTRGLTLAGAPER